jgi:DNA-binding transcriptional LysR family regulator
MPNENIGNMRLMELRVFQAILESRSITAAAETLGVSQSKVSKQLKLMRSWFGDELFVRTGSGMEATSKAEALAPKVKALIHQFELLDTETQFDPLDIERNLVISTTDEVEHFLLPKLIGRIATDSPQSRIIFKVLERDYAAKQLELGNVDLVITPNWHIPEHLKQKLVYADDFVVLFRKGHPLEMQKLEIENYLSARHLMVSPLGTVVGPIDEALASVDHRRTVSVATPYFMNVTDALLSSDLLLTIQRRAATELVNEHALVQKELPIRVPPVNYFLIWHKRYDKDSVNCWLRQIIHEILCVQPVGF